MRLIRLTRIDGEPCWVNPAAITTIEPNADGVINIGFLGGNWIEVRESGRDIELLVLGAGQPATGRPGQ